MWRVTRQLVWGLLAVHLLPLMVLAALPHKSVIFSEYHDADSTKMSSDSLFVWDMANQRLGIGTSTPSQVLDVNGTVSATAITADGAGLTGLTAFTVINDGLAYTAGNVAIGMSTATYPFQVGVGGAGGGNQLSNSTIGSIIGIGGNANVGQTFTATLTGEVTNFKVYLQSTSAQTCAFRFYNGTPSDANMVFEDSRAVSAGTQLHSVTPNTTINISSGGSYAVGWKCPSTSLMHYTNTNPYAGGTRFIEGNPPFTADDISFEVNEAVISAHYVMVDSSGNVGVQNTTPAYTLEVGDTGSPEIAISNNWSLFSDRRYKSDIREITDVLERVRSVEAKQYKWKSNGKKSVGVIAQEIELRFPELVTENKEGMKSVDYARMNAILFAALGELENEHKSEIQSLRERQAKLSKSVASLKYRRMEVAAKLAGKKGIAKGGANYDK